MKSHGGMWLPDHEAHLLTRATAQHEPTIDGRIAYQWKKIAAVFGLAKNFRTAVDIGGHVGYFSIHFAKRFSAVHAFEPVAAHRECFEKNVTAENVTLHACALGKAPGSVSIQTTKGSSGDSWVSGEGDIPLKTLDSFELPDVDLIKADCEGFELFALQGGEQTICRCLPVIIVEQKPGRAQKFGLPETGAVSFLQGLGYTLAKELSGDFIMTPPAETLIDAIPPAGAPVVFGVDLASGPDLTFIEQPQDVGVVVEKDQIAGGGGQMDGGGASGSFDTDTRSAPSAEVAQDVGKAETPDDGTSKPPNVTAVEAAETETHSTDAESSTVVEGNPGQES